MVRDALMFDFTNFCIKAINYNIFFVYLVDFIIEFLIDPALTTYVHVYTDILLHIIFTYAYMNVPEYRSSKV